MLGSGNSSNREGKTISSDMPRLPQCLPLDPITLSSQKYTRSGELRRVLGVPSGTTSEDHSFGPSNQKPHPPVATEELKHFKESVKDSSRKAQDRAEKLHDSLNKLETYRGALSSKKRQRGDVSSVESSVGAKSGSQMHRHPQDLMNQRAEDRLKSVKLNKRIRSSVADIRADVKVVASSREQIITEKDGDMLPNLSGTTVRIEEKIRRLPIGGEGWDKKMKRKRSVGAVGTRGINSDRDSKRTMQPKLSAESKLRSCDIQALRSKSSTGVGGINKLNGSFEGASSTAATLQRNDLDAPPPPRERLAILEQRAVVKGSNRPKIQEENRSSSPSTMLKGKASRAQRTGSLMVLDSSSKVHPSSGAFQGWEESTSVNKVPGLGITNNQKPPSSASSPAHPMAQWVGQRRHKNSRTRRANIVSPVANSETQVPSQGFSTCESGRTSFGTSASLLTSSTDNKAPKINRAYEHVSSPFGFSESEESGAGENSLKEKRIVSGDGVLSAAKVRLQTKKNKIQTNETGDIGRRQGQTGSTTYVTRPTIHLPREKSEPPPTPRPLQNIRSASDKNKSKSGRPPSKKFKDRKVSIRIGMLSSASEFTGESDDDCEDIFAAAKAARNAGNLACSGPLWKKMEPIFASLDPKDLSYLKQQLSYAEELDESLSQMFGVEYQGILVRKDISNPSTESQESHAKQEPAKTNALCGRFDTGRGDKATPLYQRVLSALIEEDETEEFYHHGEGKNLSLHYASDDSHCGSCNQNDIEPKDRDRMESEVESIVDFQSQKICLMDRLSCNKSAATNTFRNPSMSSSSHSDEQWLGDGDFTHSDVGLVSEICSNDLARLQAKETSVPGYSPSDCQYQVMCLNDKILLELKSIGLFPEALPGLAEEEVLNQDVIELKEGLYQQIVKKKKTLREVDKNIQKVRESEKRKIEHTAMDQLLEIAYKKRMAYRGNHASKTGIRKVSKQAALAFINRTLARCRKFEDTGSSCFNEPAVQNILFSSPPCSSDAKSADGVGSGTASNTCNEASNRQTEARASGAVTSALERYDTQSDDIDGGSSDALQAGVQKHGVLSNKGKKEAVVDDVVASASSRVTSTLENSSIVGARGKRSENKDNFRSNSGSMAVQTSTEGFKNDCKHKQNINNNHSSTPGNRDHGRLTMSGSNSSATNNDTSNKRGREVDLSTSGNKVHQEKSKDAEDPIDFPFDSLELCGPQDIGNWFNLDEDGLQDHDSIGLEIPMDDLSDLNMFL